ncbi:MAG: Sec-dependent nitrous-oxide reductase [Thermomicrobiales bacterium]|nr:Sec-dependent nitrous-oxide reductase [Thermomicrobiales bacterium]
MSKDIQELTGQQVNRRKVVGGIGAAATLPAVAAMAGVKQHAVSARQDDLPSEVNSIISERELTPEDVTAALETFMPSGRMDDYMMFSSSGHAGMVFAIGVPSMRNYRSIAVFTPEPWQGFGFSDESKAVLEQGAINGKVMHHGDTHHPALSETDGDYDGQYLFINEKAHGRIGVVDLSDFQTKQLVKNPLLVSEHGGCFVTPNTEYVLEADQYPGVLGIGNYAPLSEFEDKYRGLCVLWKFDRERGRIVHEESFAIETPPYGHDLGDAGKGACDGYAFWNTFNTEMAYGGIKEGNPPLEIGASQHDMDLMTIVDWKKAEQVVADGKAIDNMGMKFIPMDVAVAEGLMYMVPEPKSPHGVDVTPDGNFIVVSGKLDPHVTIFSWEKIKAAIDAGGYETDQFGVPVLGYEDCLETQVELGLGPLHTQYDDKGYAYTSLFLDSAVARWTVGEAGNPDSWKLVEKLPVQYNVGHICAAGGDTKNPSGRYLVALNKWSLDRFPPVGPLLPQNLQLIDIREDKPFRALYDMPMGYGEPHYAQMIPMDRLETIEVYPQEKDRVGWDPIADDWHPHGIPAGQERIEVDGTTVTVYMTVMRSHFTPDIIEVTEGDTVTMHITNIENAIDATHGFVLGGQDISLSLEAGETETVTFVADTAGVYPFYCTEFCSALHIEMAGYFLVKPADA